MQNPRALDEDESERTRAGSEHVELGNDIFIFLNPLLRLTAAAYCLLLGS